MKDPPIDANSSPSHLSPEFLNRLRKRDPDVLAQTVRSHTRPLFRAARGMGFDREEAEDLVQEVFTIFLETLDRFRGHSQVRTWLFGILHRKVMEHRRASYREKQKDPIDEVVESRFNARGAWIRPPGDLERLIESKEIGTFIRACMEGLPASQREVFVLRDVQELESDEICKILDISRSNLFVLIYRARNRLRECIEEKQSARPTS